MKKDVRIVARVTAKEKKNIESNARRCQLSTAEYLRQLALGYQPRAFPLEELFSLFEKLDRVIDREISPEVTQASLELLQEIERELITTPKRNVSEIAQALNQRLVS